MSASSFATLTAPGELFRLLLEAAPDAMVVTRQDGRIILVNAQTEKLFGYHREELLGQKVEVLLPAGVRRQHSINRARYLRHLSVRAMGSGLEVLARRKDGTEFPVDIGLSPLAIDGTVLVSTAIRDITERKQADELASHLAAIVQASDDAIVGKSLDGTILSWNPGAERLYGYKAEEMIGRGIELLVPPDRAREHTLILKGLRRGKHFEHCETIRVHKDGHLIQVSITISPIRDKAGMVTGASVIARDITERKQADALISHLAAIVETSDDAIIAESLDGKITSWNSGAEKLYGFKAEEVVGQALSRVMKLGSAGRAAGILKALRKGEHIEPLEVTQAHRDGHPIETSITISPIRNRGGAVIGASVIARDITRQKRAEEAVRQSEERFRMALQNAPVAVFNQDRQLRFTWINAPGLPWVTQDCLGRTDAELVEGPEGARLTAIKREVLRTGVGTRTETKVICNGEPCYFVLVVEPLRDARGIVQGLTCAVTDITATKKSLLERESLVAKLQEALDEVKLLSGLLSICASCKKITNERGDWEPLESYLQKHSEAKFSHGMCPDCLQKLYPEYYPATGKKDVKKTAPAKPGNSKK